MRKRHDSPPPDPKTLQETALRILSVRDHSAEQLRRKLVRRGYEGPLVDVEIARLRERGYLDDARWAEQAARSRLRARYGRRRIQWELAAAGVEGEIGEAALARAGSEEDEEARMQEACARRAESLSRRHGTAWMLSDEARTKLAKHLLQRGYEPSAIIRCVDEALRTLADEGDDAHNRRSGTTGDEPSS